MKFICTKADLLKGVNVSLKAVPAKSTMTILECIFIDTSLGEIKFTSNDMELGIETVIEGTILEKGTIALNAKIFSDIIRKLPDNDVMIETDENYQTTITCEKTKISISGKSGEDFPALPSIEKKDPIVISQFSLKEIIKQTIFSISDNDNNKMMTGELFEVNNNELKVVSLDGHRVSIRKLGLTENYEYKKAIIPGKTLLEISKILSGEMNDLINIFLTQNHTIFEFDKTTIVSRLIEGEYFRIDQMLSNDYDTKVTINKQEFLNCIDRSTLLVKEGDKKPIIIQIEDGNMELSIITALGSMNEDIMIEKEGKDLMIGFNPKFLIDALRVIDDDDVTLYLVNPKAPCFIKNESETYIYLVLPINFNNTTR